MKKNITNLLLYAFICFLIPGCVSSENETIEKKDPFKDALYKNSLYTIEERVADLLYYMTLEER